MKISSILVIFVWLADCCYLCSASFKRLDMDPCSTDSHCENGSYCKNVNDESMTGALSPNHRCAPCQNCSELQRWSLRPCGQGPLGQCGGCLQGYQEILQSRDDITSILPCGLIGSEDNSLFWMTNTSHPYPDNDEVQDTAETSSEILMTSQVLLLIGIAVGALLAAILSVLLGRVYHKRLSKRSNDAIAHLEDFNRKLPEVLPTTQSLEPLVYWDQKESWQQNKEKA